MYTHHTTNPQHGGRGVIQLRLFPLHTVGVVEPCDDPQIRHWSLPDIRALAIDLDVEMRRLAALSNWVVDADLQRVLATDPDEGVVLNLLSKVDPHAEANRLILTGPHTRARRELARRNLTTATLLPLIEDTDEVVRAAAHSTLERRGQLVTQGPNTSPSQAQARARTSRERSALLARPAQDAAVMTALLVVSVIAGFGWLLVWSIRRSLARAKAVEIERARAHASYLRQRAELLANASPVDAHAFLMAEQTNALIDAQRRNAAALGLMIWLNGSNNPFETHDTTKPVSVYISVDEWRDIVGWMHASLDHTEQSPHGHFLLECCGTERTWVTSDGAQTTVVRGDGPAPRGLPDPNAPFSVLVNFRFFRRRTPQDATLTVTEHDDGRYQTFVTDGVEMTMPEHPAPFGDCRSILDTVTGHSVHGDTAQLREACSAASIVPFGIDETNDPVHSWMSVHDGCLRLSSPWINYPATTIDVPLVEHAADTVPALIDIGRMIGLLAAIDVERTTLRLPNDPMLPIGLRAGHYEAVLMPVDRWGAERHRLETLLCEFLDVESITADEEGDYPVTTPEGHDMWVRLHTDTDPITIQVFSVLATHVDPNPGLFEELNSINAAAGHVKVIWASSAVMAEVDLVAEALDPAELGNALRVVRRTAEQYRDVPRLSQLTDLLWTGGALPVRHDAATRVITHWAELGIRAVVDTRAEWTDEDLVAAVVPEIEYLNPGVVDGGQPMPDSWFEAITTFTARHHALRHGVLVHCHSGVNRGPSGAFTVLLTQGWDPVDAIERIRSTYPVANVSYAENAIDW
ncbi:unnamed protein product, partial [Symbiodinium sp. KB8]